MEILIHIGTHKTATTYIQNILWSEREALDQTGILYPEAGYYDGAHHRLGGSLVNGMDCNILKRIDAPRFNTLAEIPWWQDFVSEVNAKRPDRVLISSEEFEWYTSPIDLIDFLATALPRYQIRIAICLRRQEEFLESLYQEFVREPKVREKRFFRQAMGDLRFANYDKLISRWEYACGENAIKVVRFDDLKSRGILAGYMDFLDLPMSLNDRLEQRQHDARDIMKEALPAVCVEFLRLCNQTPISVERHKRILKALYEVREPLLKRYGPACLRILPPNLRNELRERFKDSNERVRARYFPRDTALFADLEDTETLLPTLHVRDIIPLLVRQGLI